MLYRPIHPTHRHANKARYPFIKNDYRVSGSNPFEGKSRL